MPNLRDQISDFRYQIKSLTIPFLPLTPSSGFTLIELLITITIIGVLASIGVAAYSNSTRTGEDARRRADVDAIAQAYELVYNPRTRQYSPVFGTDFTNKIFPTPPEGGQYIGLIPAGTTPSSFAVCAVLSSGRAADCNGRTTNGGCYCKQSVYGVQPTPVL